MKFASFEYSFDVFDTVITRIWYTPSDLFWAVGQRLRELGFVDDQDQWVIRRKESETVARQKALTEDITLTEIYKFLAPHYHWSVEQTTQAMNVEIEVELRSIRVIRTMQTQIQALHQLNTPVIYLSDMYLPAEVIRTALRKEQLWFEGDLLFVSSELGLTKHSGNLYKHLLRQKIISQSKFIHTGDNEHSDVKMAHQLGLKAKLFRDQKPNRYEQTLANLQSSSIRFRSLLAGISRVVRLSEKIDAENLRTIWDTASNVIGPALFGYVFWVLEEAKKRQIQRLYFVARDGQILLKIAEILNEQWHYNLTCKYLYGSRHAWHIPAIDKVGEAELEWILVPTYFLSIHSVCERVNLNPHQIESALSKYGFLPSEWKDNLDAAARERLKLCFQEGEVRRIIEQVAQECRQATLGYFEQEGLLLDSSFAIVDIGWNGRLQRSLSFLLAKGGFRPKNGITGFYFGLIQKLKAFENDSLLCYLTDPERKDQADYLCQYGALYEIFVAADHGSTIGYRQIQNGAYFPILRQPSNEKALKWGLATQQQAIVRFTHEMSQNLSAHEVSCEGLKEAAQKVLSLFLLKPSKAEAQVYGGFDFFEDQTETISNKICPPISIQDFVKWYFFQQNTIYHNAWLEGVLVQAVPQSSDFFLRLFKATNKFRSLHRKLNPKSMLKKIKQALRLISSLDQDCSPRFQKLPKAIYPSNDTIPRVNRFTQDVPTAGLDRYAPTIVGPSSLVPTIFRTKVITEVLQILSKLEADDYVQYTQNYYREGMQRFGEDWRYADIVTVLYSVASLMQPEQYLEIGVRRGRSMAMVAAACPTCNLLGFDLWLQAYSGMQNPGPKFVQNELQKLNHRGKLDLISGNSHETVKQYLSANPTAYFDLITVDGDHSRLGAALDLAEVLPRLKIGGVIVFDDLAHPQHLYLREVWKTLVEQDQRFGCWVFDELGYGVALGIRKW